MDWITNYQLFLFDFDGLLVDTEQLHHLAYIEMCKQRGFNLSWNFEKYSSIAHHSSEALKQQIYSEFPALFEQESDWRILYKEKSSFFFDFLLQGNISLMPGVEKLLVALDKANIKRCVVTHSALKLIEKIKSHHAVLNSIPHWITREDYLNPKPDPECYQLAIKKYGSGCNRIIGFEDSPRGLSALLGTSTKPVLICPPHYKYIEETLRKWPQVVYFPSFDAIQQTKIL